MFSYPNYTTIEQIKGQLSIMDVIEKYTNMDLQRVRTNRKAFNVSCIFHGEDKNPSMTIWTDTNRFKCHACHVKGDQIDLVAQALNMPLKDVIPFLARELMIEEPSQEIQTKVNKRKQEREIKQQYQEMKDQVFFALLSFERGIENEFIGVTSIETVAVLSPLYHVYNRAGDILDRIVHGTGREQIAAVLEGLELICSYGDE